MLSRVAESLYWMSRYSERAEHTARVLDVPLNLGLDYPAAAGGERWAHLLDALGAEVPAAALADPYEAAHALTFDAANPASIVWSITRARENARQVRELVSSEMWEQLNELFLYVSRPEAGRAEWAAHGPYEVFGRVKRGMHVLQGITDSTMQHAEGWLFIETGRFLERADTVASLVELYFRRFLTPENPYAGSDRYLEWVGLLRSCTAFEAYCKMYTAELRSDRIAEFLLLDSGFPHAVRFSAERVDTALCGIARFAEAGRRADRLSRTLGRVVAMLRYTTIGELLPARLGPYLAGLRAQLAEIHTALNETYIDYPIEAALPG